MKISVLVGTRPEAIKLAPVIQALSQHTKHQIFLCATGQHKELLELALLDFQLKPDAELKVMTEGQALPDLTATLLTRLSSFYIQTQPDWIIVQGDTATVMGASLCAYYHGIKVAHVEAGLRSFNKWSPFPEEANRKITAVLADLHFAPTATAKDNLLAEGIPDSQIYVTGNTIVDAMQWMLERFEKDKVLPSEVLSFLKTGKKIVLVTCHRRENFGEPLLRIAKALRKIASSFPDIGMIFPVHPNPQIQRVMRDELKNIPNILLLRPLSYQELLSVMHSAVLILTDSGGIQEEAPSLHVPVLVLRDTTERPEGVTAGFAKLVGSDTEAIFQASSAILNDVVYAQNVLRNKKNPYGDGKASLRIAQVFNDM